MLKKYNKILDREDLNTSYSPNSACGTIDLDQTLNLNHFNDYFDKVKETNETTKHDEHFSKLLYEAIIESKIPDTNFNDLRLWQWIALNPLREYTLWRWGIESDESNKKSIRFLGAGGVTGFSNNAASRLFFPALSISEAPDAEDLLKYFWSNTQIELSISQSILSLNPKIFIAAVRATQGIETTNLTRVVSDVIVSLNLSSGSTLLDIMEEGEITALMKQD
jgi:hypothetical protein